MQHKADFVVKPGHVGANETDLLYVSVKKIKWPKGVPVDTFTTCKDGKCGKECKLLVSF